MVASDDFLEAVRLEGTVAAPEPASLTLLGIGIAGIAGYRWRRNVMGKA
jgi:PEP-CTERM motif